jgi:DNA polymerase
MQSEMPKKYWKNLPEASLIADLIAGSGGRVRKMLGTETRPPKLAPKNAYLNSLHEMNASQPPPPEDPTQDP